MRTSFRQENILNRLLFISGIVLSYVSVVLLLSSCSGDKSFDLGATTTSTSTTSTTTTTTTTLPSYSGYMVVSSVTTDPATGPGFLSLYDPQGNFVRVLRDYFASGTEWAAGTTFVAPDQLVVVVESSTSDRIETFSIDDPDNITNQGVGFVGGAPLRQIAKTSSGEFFIVENNGATSTIEKFDSGFSRSGGPFIGVGTTCSLNNNTPYGIAYLPTLDRIAVTASGGRFNLYDSSTGTCISSINTGTFTAGNAPSGIAYHAIAGKLLVVLASGNAIHSCDLDGTNCAAVYSSAGILNNPRSIAVASDGSIFVSSSGNDNILKFSAWSGTGNLSLAADGNPYIAIGAYTQNVQSIMVIP